MMIPEMMFESESRAANPIVKPTIPREVRIAEVLMPIESRAVTAPKIKMVYLIMELMKILLVSSSLDRSKMGFEANLMILHTK